MFLAKHLKKYSFLFGLIIFAFILSRINFSQLWAVIKNLKISFFALAVLMVPVLFFVKSLCWNYLMRVQGIRYGLADTYLMTNAGIAIGTLTPGRVGEIIKLAYLKKDGFSVGKSLLTIVLDRLSDFIVLAAFGYFGLLVLFGSFYKITLYFGLAALLPIGLFLLFKKQLVRQAVKKALLFFVPAKYQESFQLNLGDFTKGLKAYRPKDYFIVVLVTGLSWLVYYLQTFFLAKSLGINTIPFFYLSVIVTITGLAALLPISVMGLGTREGMLILFFALFSVSQELAVSFSFLILSMSFVAGALGGLALLIKPIHLKK